jgi:hypothetical protein
MRHGRAVLGMAGQAVERIIGVGRRRQ